MRQTIGSTLSAVTASAPVATAGPIELEVAAAPLTYTFAWTDAAGTRRELGAARTRYLSSEVAGGFTGAYVGLYATSGKGAAAASTFTAFFDWLDYEPREAAAAARAR